MNVYFPLVKETISRIDVPVNFAMNCNTVINKSPIQRAWKLCIRYNF